MYKEEAEQLNLLFNNLRNMAEKDFFVMKIAPDLKSEYFKECFRAGVDPYEFINRLFKKGISHCKSKADKMEQQKTVEQHEKEIVTTLAKIKKTSIIRGAQDEQELTNRKD